MYEQGKIIQHTHDYYKKLFQTSQLYSNNRHEHLGLAPQLDLSSLNEDLFKIEIWDAINSFQPNKAPRPDEFHPFFYQNYWGSVGNSVVDFCKETWANGFIDPHINATHICLIPKTRNATTLKNFRPISLCNTTYKILTKVIANKLKPLMNQLIGPHQVSFLKNR